MNADQYIISVKRSFLLILTLSLVDIFCAYTEYSRNNAIQLSELVGLSYATLQTAPIVFSLPDLRTSTLGLINPFEGAKELSLATTYSQALHEAEMKRLPPPPLPAGLADEPIPGIKFAHSISYPMQESGCSAMFFRGPTNFPIRLLPNRTFGDYDNTIRIPAIISADRAMLANFSWRCDPFRFGLTNLLFIQPSELHPEYWLIGVPYELFRHMDATVPLNITEMALPTQIETQPFLAAVPDRLQQIEPIPLYRKVWIDSKYAILTPKALEYVIMTFANLSSEIKIPNIDLAMSAISRFKQTTIPVLGLPTLPYS
jgi:hypothetical protein